MGVGDPADAAPATGSRLRVIEDWLPEDVHFEALGVSYAVPSKADAEHSSEGVDSQGARNAAAAGPPVPTVPQRD